VNTAEQLWRTLFDAADGMKLIHSDAKRLSLFYQVTVSQLKMVRTVFELTRDSENGVSLKNVARQLGTTAAAASEMVDVLVRKKILDRRQDPADRRQVQIRLISELHEHFLQVEERFTIFTSAFLETLPPEKQALFA
jgi:DNA-binding MarR family transcriptional regulator